MNEHLETAAAPSEGTATEQHSSIALCMIVKDEAHIIAETLASVVDHVDYFSIVDTGSTDDTLALVERFFADRSVLGRIHQRPWVNFGHNRSEALALARGYSDYILMLDADDLVHFPGPVGPLDADGYTIVLQRGSLHYRYTLLTRSDAPWRYEGPVHEYPVCDLPSPRVEPLDERWWIESRALGARSLARDKYERDAALLFEHLKSHPGDPRTTFYLAQSLQDAGQSQEAIEWYRRRVELGGWAEEVFISLYRIGEILAASDAEEHEVLGALISAWEFRPSRAEPLHVLARWYRLKGNYRRALLAARNAASLPQPTTDVLFVEELIYRWQARDELAIALYYTGWPKDAGAIWRDILEHQDLSDEDEQRLRDNLGWTEHTD